MNETVLEVPQQKITGSKDYFNPFPGLRSFGTDESHLFFGREGQSEDLLSLLTSNRFVAVTGTSGSGKSSLVNCGLIPILQGGFIANAGSAWKIVAFSPGENPIISLSKALSTSLYEETNSTMNESVTEIILRRSSLGLLEVIKQANLKQGENILLVVDQFEELFRYKDKDKDYSLFNESGAFVKLMVETIRQQKLPVYTVITMRSDFIGDCAHFQELTKLINQSNYLIPQMTRDDFRKSIEGPVAVNGAKIDPQLVDQLLNDIGNAHDQLPLLQHVLMRTWDFWLQSGDVKRPIGFPDYEATGRMQKALSEHANEAFNQLNEEGKKICERLFKTLTQKINDRGISRPSKVEEIAEIAWASVDQVIEVIEKFRQPGRSFLNPPYTVPINKDSVIDLSHESLMRIWDKLKIWVEEEDASIRMYKRLAEDAALYQASRFGLLKPPKLLLALAWEKEQRPTLAWAKRYNPTFERTKVFLRASEKEYEAEEMHKVKLQVRKLRRTKLISTFLGIAVIAALLLTLYVQSLRIHAEKAQNRAEIEKRNANEQKLIAEKKSHEALQQKEMAFRLKSLSDAKSQISEKQKVIALRDVDSAKNQIAIANSRAQEFQEQQSISEKNAKESISLAVSQAREAETAREEVYKRRMVAIAKTMAIKSLDINDDNELKGLVAYQAYLLNRRYGGNDYNVDIFSGMYKALESLNNKMANVYRGHTDAVNAVAFVPRSNIFFSAGSDGQVMRWNLDDNTKTPVMVINNKVINKVMAISNNGKWLACGTSGMGILFFDLRIGNWSPRYCKGGPVYISALTFMPDNRHIVASGEDNKVYIWDLEQGGNKLAGTTQSLVLSLSVSPDGNLIAAGTKDGKIVLWETNDFTTSVLYDNPKTSVEAVTFNHSGRTLASGDLQGNIKYWNVSKKTMITNLHAHSARITDLKFSPNDELLASSSFDANVQLWFTNDLSGPPVKLQNHTSWVLTIAFNASGDKIVSGSLNGNRLVVDPTLTKSMGEIFCQKMDRNMTPNEWNTYVGKDIPYEKTCGN